MNFFRLALHKMRHFGLRARTRLMLAVNVLRRWRLERQLLEACIFVQTARRYEHEYRATALHWHAEAERLRMRMEAVDRQGRIA